MQKLLNSGVEFVDLIPGASIKVTAMGGGSYSIITLSSKEGDVSFGNSSTEKTGVASAGPFRTFVTVQIETKGKSSCSVLQPEVTPLVEQAAVRQLPRAAIIGTSIMEPRQYRQSTGFVDNGDGIYAVAAVDSSSGATPGSGQPVALRNITGVCNAQTATTSNNIIDSHGQGTNKATRSALRQVIKTAVGRFRAPASTHGAPSLARASVWILVGPNASICVDIGRVGCYKV